MSVLPYVRGSAGSMSQRDNRAELGPGASRSGITDCKHSTLSTRGCSELIEAQPMLLADVKAAIERALVVSIASTVLNILLR